MTRNEILEKVYAGSKFYVNFEKRSVRVDGKLVVENGDFGEDTYEKEGDFCHRHIVAKWLDAGIKELPKP